MFIFCLKNAMPCCSFFTQRSMIYVHVKHLDLDVLSIKASKAISTMCHLNPSIKRMGALFNSVSACSHGGDIHLYNRYTGYDTMTLATGSAI